MRPSSLPLPLPESASGDRLTRGEFEHRYAAMPQLIWAIKNKPIVAVGCRNIGFGQSLSSGWAG